MFFAPNPKQKIAIEHERGPMLVVASAGTGKTSVLVQRVARLVRTDLAAGIGDPKAVESQWWCRSG